MNEPIKPKKRQGGKQTQAKRTQQMARWYDRNREKWNAYIRAYRAKRRAAAKTAPSFLA